MKKYLEQLQTKPHHVKKRVVVAATIFISGLIVIFWMITLGVKFSSPAQKSEFERSVRPFQMIGESFKNTFQSAKTDFMKK